MSCSFSGINHVNAKPYRAFGQSVFLRIPRLFIIIITYLFIYFIDSLENIFIVFRDLSIERDFFQRNWEILSVSRKDRVLFVVEMICLSKVNSLLLNWAIAYFCTDFSSFQEQELIRRCTASPEHLRWAKNCTILGYLRRLVMPSLFFWSFNLLCVHFFSSLSFR